MTTCKTCGSDDVVAKHRITCNVCKRIRLTGDDLLEEALRDKHEHFVLAREALQAQLRAEMLLEQARGQCDRIRGWWLKEKREHLRTFEAGLKAAHGMVEARGLAEDWRDVWTPHHMPDGPGLPSELPWETDDES